jgi:hypothetical protein
MSPNQNGIPPEKGTLYLGEIMPEGEGLVQNPIEQRAIGKCLNKSERFIKTVREHMEVSILAFRYLAAIFIPIPLPRVPGR